jgi:hypothetical protein
MRVVAAFALVAGLFASSFTTAVAQRPGAFGGARDHPAINYTNGPTTDAVTALNQALASGAATLAFDESKGGYLPAVLEALKVPVSSQVLVFAETSIQARKINRGNPRAVYFNDTVSVAWVRGGDMIEVASHDPQQGTLFYSFPVAAAAAPRFTRNDTCLACHLSWDTLAVPGYILQTVFPRKDDREYAGGGFVDHRLPVEERWGGWFVTGRQVPARHMGNQPMIQPKPRTGPIQKLATVRDEFDTTGYPLQTSDVAALLVLDHQAHALNLLTRLNWEARAGTPARVDEAATELADYLLFVDEAPIPGKVAGSSGFAEAFAAGGPRDGQGRSLRDLKLEGRLMQYPLSYLIYTPAFEALPAGARTAVISRLSAVLTGKDTRPKYAHLTPALRTAVLEILADTRPGLIPPS